MSRPGIQPGEGRGADVTPGLEQLAQIDQSKLLIPPVEESVPVVRGGSDEPESSVAATTIEAPPDAKSEPKPVDLVPPAEPVPAAIAAPEPKVATKIEALPDSIEDQIDQSVGKAGDVLESLKDRKDLRQYEKVPQAVGSLKFNMRKLNELSERFPQFHNDKKWQDRVATHIQEIADNIKIIEASLSAGPVEPARRSREERRAARAERRPAAPPSPRLKPAPAPEPLPAPVETEGEPLDLPELLAAIEEKLAPFKGKLPADLKHERDLRPEVYNILRDLWGVQATLRSMSGDETKDRKTYLEKGNALLRELKQAEVLAPKNLNFNEAAAAAALYTIAHLKPGDAYRELEHDNSGRELKTEDERRERFKELIRKYWKEFTTHGMFGDVDPKTGQAKVLPMSDLDASAVVFLLCGAGIHVDEAKINYVEQGGSTDSGVQIDTGGGLGIKVDKGGQRLSGDHHTEDPKEMPKARQTSAAKMFYEMLSNPEIGVLKPEPWLEKFVDFVTREDNKNYTDAEAKQYWDNYGRNFVSLASNLPFPQMRRFFEDKELRARNCTILDALTDEELARLDLKFKYAPLKKDNRDVTLADVLKRKARLKETSQKGIEELEAEGLVVDTGGRFGKVLIDNGWKSKKGQWQKRVPLNFDAARPNGYGAYVVWLPEKKQFTLKTVNPVDFALPQAINVRGHYLLKGDVTTDLEFTLEEALAKLTGDPNYKMPAELKAAVEKQKIVAADSGSADVEAEPDEPDVMWSGEKGVESSAPDEPGPGEEGKNILSQEEIDRILAEAEGMGAGGGEKGESDQDKALAEYEAVEARYRNLANRDLSVEEKDALFNLHTQAMPSELRLSREGDGKNIDDLVKKQAEATEALAAAVAEAEKAPIIPDEEIKRRRDQVLIEARAYVQRLDKIMRAADFAGLEADVQDSVTNARKWIRQDITQLEDDDNVVQMIGHMDLLRVYMGDKDYLDIQSIENQLHITPAEQPVAPEESKEHRIAELQGEIAQMKKDLTAASRANNRDGYLELWGRYGIAKQQLADLQK